MSAPVKKCEVCDDTGSKSRDISGDLDCTACSAADERVAMRDKLGPMMWIDEVYAWRGYQLGKAAAQPKENIERPTDYDIIMMACEIALQDDVWEINDADLIPFVRRCIAAAAPVVPAGHMPPEQGEMISASLALSPWLAAALDDPQVCSEYKTAISAWFNTAMPSATVDAFHARILDTNHILEDQLSKFHAPVVPVAAQPVVPEGWRIIPKKTCYALVHGNVVVANLAGPDAEANAAIIANAIANIAPAAAPSLEAQPAGEVIPAEKLCALLPGPYYMDPPDGGSVTVLEQVERMAKDAARFAWLIENASSGSLGFGDWWINGDEPAEEWRAAFDDAMAQGEKP